MEAAKPKWSEFDKIFTMSNRGVVIGKVATNADSAVKGTSVFLLTDSSDEPCSKEKSRGLTVAPHNVLFLVDIDIKEATEIAKQRGRCTAVSA